MMERMIRANRSRIKGCTGVWQEMSAEIPKEKFMESRTTRTLEALTNSRRWQQCDIKDVVKPQRRRRRRSDVGYTSCACVATVYT